MYQFIWPIVFLILPLPLLFRLFFRASHSVANTSSKAIKVPFFYRLQKFNLPIQNNQHRFSPLLWTLVWICCIVAAARPVWFGKPIPLHKESRNIMLALDVSGSMEEQDFDIYNRPITRLDMVKMLAKDFIQKRENDNLGLVIFGSEAYTYAPLSPDTKTLTGLLNEIGIGIAGNQTAMGDALAMAVQSVTSVPEHSRIVILMSDGFANAGNVSIEEALQVAKEAKVKVYTIGIGSDKQDIQDFFGFVQMNTTADLDEATLQKIAQETQGKYFRAKSSSDLKSIYEMIDQLETTPAQDESVRPRKELAFYLILIALALWAVGVMMEQRV